MHVMFGVDFPLYIALHDICQGMSYPMMRALSTFHVIICDMTIPLSRQDRVNVSIIKMDSSFHPPPPPPHPSAVPYVSLGSVSNDDTKIIEEFVNRVSLFKNAKQSYPECLCLFRHRRVQHP